MPVFPPALTMGEFNLFVAAMCTSMVNGQEIRQRVSGSEHRMVLSLHALSILFYFSLIFMCARSLLTQSLLFGIADPLQGDPARDVRAWLSSQAAGSKTTLDTCHEVARDLEGRWPSHDRLSFQSVARNRRAARQRYDNGPCHFHKSRGWLQRPQSTPARQGSSRE